MEDHKEIAEPFTKDRLAMERMPGHWVLAQMGKRVLRPGGMELTRAMLEALAIGAGLGRDGRLDACARARKLHRGGTGSRRRRITPERCGASRRSL